MRKIAVLFVVLWLGACANLASVTNPVTPQMLNTAENTMIVIFAGLNAYKESCAQKIIPDSCRGVIAEMQSYTIRVPALLGTARRLVRSGDQINAITAYNELINLMTSLRQQAAAKGVVVP